MASLALRLRDEDINAELELLRRRREDAPYSRRVDAIYADAYGAVVRALIAKLNNLRQLRGHRPFPPAALDELFSNCRAHYWHCVDAFERECVRRDADPESEWRTMLRREVGGRRYSLLLDVDIHARSWLNSQSTR